MSSAFTIKPFLENHRLFLVEFGKREVKHKGYDLSGKACEIRGLQITRIVDQDCNEISESSQKASCDISILAGEDACIVSVVSLDNGKSITWEAMEVLTSDKKKTQFILGKKWVPNGEEIDILNKTFPGYFEHSAVDHKEFVERNKEFVTTDEGETLLNLPEGASDEKAS